MAKTYSGGTTLGTGFKLNDPQPIADYMVVDFITDLETIPNQFIGMTSFVGEDDKFYVKKSTGWEIIGESDFVPLSGTEVDKPITGDLEFDNLDGTLYKIYGINANEGESGIKFGSVPMIDDSDNLGFYEYSNPIYSNKKMFIGFAAGNPSMIFKDSFINGTSLSESSYHIYSNNPNFKGITGEYVFDKQNDPNAFAQLGDVLKNQITKSGNQTLDNTYNGKVITFTGSGTFTVNNTIAEEGSFVLKVETGVTVAWAITSPATWRVGGLTVGTAPRSLVGGDMVYVARKGSSNEIEVYGL